MCSSLGLSDGLCAVRRVVVGECSEVGRGVLVLSKILPKRSFDQFWSWNRHTFLVKLQPLFLVSFSILYYFIGTCKSTTSDVMDDNSATGGSRGLLLMQQFATVGHCYDKYYCSWIDRTVVL